jgi:branched-chain amino acid transport system ATP-binding protein
VSYGPVRALREVSIEIQPGQVRAIVGPNGAGKTSLARTMCGLVRPTSGQVFLDGFDVTRLTPEARADRGITLVPEGRGIFPTMTVTDNLLVGRDIGRGSRVQIDDMLTLFPTLERLQDRRAGLLSGGEQQLLSLARALMTEPKVLILDEPSMGLSPIAVADVMAVLANLGTSGPAVLLVEQNTRLAVRLADYVYVLQHGQVLIEGNADEIVMDDILREVYLGAQTR